MEIKKKRVYLFIELVREIMGKTRNLRPWVFHIYKIVIYPTPNFGYL